MVRENPTPAIASYNRLMNTRWLLYTCAFVCGILALTAAAMAFVSEHPLSWPVARSASQAASAALSTTTPDTYFVEKVVDGDTIDIYKDNETVRLRLVGMDTPEVVDPRKVVQCFGKEASAEGHKLLEGQWVRLEYDPVAGTYDKYGRMLAYVFRTDGLFYNEFMIANGYAHEYTYSGQHYTYQKEFKAAQAEAKSGLLGFWSPSTCGGNTTKPASTEAP